MAELTIDQLIKIIIGILVVVVVVAGIYFIFKNYILDFFKNMIGGSSETNNLFVALLKLGAVFVKLKVLR